jgi:hypothetical protein
MAEKKSSSFGTRKVAAKSLSDAMAEEGTDEGFGWGDVFDITVGVGTGLATRNPMAGIAAYQGTKGIREGLTEGNPAKAIQGAGQAYGAGKQVASAVSDKTGYEGIFEGKTDDEIDKMLEAEDQKRLLS